MNGKISYKKIDGEYVLAVYGVGVLIDDDFDVVLSVEEHIAKQAEKFIYNGKELKLKNGENLYSLERLNEEELAHDINIGGLGVVD